jgi:outer membrane protein TolC
VAAKPPPTLAPVALVLSDSAIVTLAVSQAPIVVTAEAIERASAAAVRAAKSLYAPDIRVTGGYAWANQSTIVGATHPGWQLALGTSFPLFNGFLREDAVARTTAAAEVSRTTAQDATRLVRTETLRLLNALRLASENIQLATEAQAAAQEDLRVQTQRYRAGISTALDQLTSELAVTQAELGLVAARYNYQIARASLEAIVGRSL